MPDFAAQIERFPLPDCLPVKKRRRTEVKYFFDGLGSETPWLRSQEILLVSSRVQSCDGVQTKRSGANIFAWLFRFDRAETNTPVSVGIIVSAQEFCFRNPAKARRVRLVERQLVTESPEKYAGPQHREKQAEPD